MSQCERPQRKGVEADVTIKTELDTAIRAAQDCGVGLAAMQFTMGDSALHALAADGGSEKDVRGIPIRFGDVPIIRTHEFPGWQLTT